MACVGDCFLYFVDGHRLLVSSWRSSFPRRSALSFFSLFCRLIPPFFLKDERLYSQLNLVGGWSKYSPSFSFAAKPMATLELQNIEAGLEGVENSGVEVLCKALEKEPFLGSLNVKSGESGGLRCRFVNRGSIMVDAVTSEDDPHAAKCKCNRQILQDEGNTVHIVLPNGEQVACEVIMPSEKHVTGGVYKKLSFLDRYLFVWILLVMVFAVLLGYYVPGIKKSFQVVEIASVSLPIAFGLWVMMYPVLCKVQYELLGRMLKDRQLVKTLLLSTFLNWIVGPAVMTAIAWATLPDLPHYRTGVIIVGIARCIAMVLIWNELAMGNSQLCAVLVAINSVLQIILFSPLALFYLKVVSRGNGLDISIWIVAKSVLVFLGIPLAAGVVTRYGMRYTVGRKFYDTKFIPFIGPWALIGLLYTIFVMFAVQAHHIISTFSRVVRVAVPLVVYFGVIFSSSVGICLSLKMPYAQTVTQSFTAAGNNFELAIAVAVGVFGIDSEEALAATIGPLIEVPVLLSLVYVMLFLRGKYFKS